MPGLIDDGGVTGLTYTVDTGLDWLAGGLGGLKGLIIEQFGPATEMITEAGDEMLTESGAFMITE